MLFLGSEHTMSQYNPYNGYMVLYDLVLTLVKPHLSLSSALPQLQPQWPPALGAIQTCSSF